MNKAVKKIALNKQTVRVLASSELAQAAGGWIRPPITWSCPQPGTHPGVAEELELARS